MECTFTPRGPKWIKVASKLHTLQRTLKALNQEHVALMETLKRLSKEENSCGNLYQFSVTERKGPIDYSSIPQLHNVNLDLYRKEMVNVWKLTTLEERLWNQ